MKKVRCRSCCNTPSAALSDIAKPSELEVLSEETAVNVDTQSNGLLVINGPALQALYSTYDDAQGHARRYTKPILASEPEAGGYRLLEARYWASTIIPVLALRMAWEAISPKERAVANGFQPSSRAVNFCLRTLMKTEQPPARRWRQSHQGFIHYTCEQCCGRRSRAMNNRRLLPSLTSQKNSWTS